MTLTFFFNWPKISSVVFGFSSKNGFILKNDSLRSSPKLMWQGGGKSWNRIIRIVLETLAESENFHIYPLTCYAGICVPRTFYMRDSSYEHMHDNFSDMLHTLAGYVLMPCLTCRDALLFYIHFSCVLFTSVRHTSFSDTYFYRLLIFVLTQGRRHNNLSAEASDGK